MTHTHICLSVIILRPTKISCQPRNRRGLLRRFHIGKLVPACGSLSNLRCREVPDADGRHAGRHQTGKDHDGEQCIPHRWYLLIFSWRLRHPMVLTRKWSVIPESAIDPVLEILKGRAVPSFVFLLNPLATPHSRAILRNKSQVWKLAALQVRNLTAPRSIGKDP